MSESKLGLSPARSQPLRVQTQRAAGEAHHPSADRTPGPLCAPARRELGVLGVPAAEKCQDSSAPGVPVVIHPANFPGSSSQSPREVLGPGTSAEQGKCRPDARRGSSREGGQDSWVLWLIAVGACSLPLAPEESFPDPNQTLCETESRPGWLGRTGSGTGRAGVVACDPGGARGRPPRLPPPPPGWPGYAASCAWWPWASEVSLRLPCKRPKRL